MPSSKDSITKSYNHNIFQILPESKVLVHTRKDHMKLKGGFREKKRVYSVITTICNVSNKRRALQSDTDHVLSFSKMLKSSDLTSSRFPNVGILSYLIALITSLSAAREKSMSATHCSS